MAEMFSFMADDTQTYAKISRNGEAFWIGIIPLTQVRGIANR